MKTRKGWRCARAAGRISTSARVFGRAPMTIATRQLEGWVGHTIALKGRSHARACGPAALRPAAAAAVWKLRARDSFAKNNAVARNASIAAAAPPKRRYAPALSRCGRGGPRGRVVLLSRRVARVREGRCFVRERPRESLGGVSKGVCELGGSAKDRDSRDPWLNEDRKDSWMILGVAREREALFLRARVGVGVNVVFKSPIAPSKPSITHAFISLCFRPPLEALRPITTHNAPVSPGPDPHAHS